MGNNLEGPSSFQVGKERVEQVFAKDVRTHIAICHKAYPEFGSWPEAAQVTYLLINKEQFFHYVVRCKRFVLLEKQSRRYLLPECLHKLF
jgi:hypothetical protein